MEQYFDNGYIINAIVLHPRQQSHDGFYLVESPEMLDSIFELISYEFEYTPRLETFFPEDGMLLIFEWNLFYGDDLLDYQISTVGDTVLVDLDVRDWSLDGDPIDPGIWVHVFPIGIECDEENHPKPDR